MIEAKDDAPDRPTMAPDEVRAAKLRETHIHPVAITELENAKTAILVDGMSENGTEIVAIVVAGIMRSGRRDENEAIEATSLKTDHVAESARDETRENNNNNDDEAQHLPRKESQHLI